MRVRVPLPVPLKSKERKNLRVINLSQREIKSIPEGWYDIEVISYFQIQELLFQKIYHSNYTEYKVINTKDDSSCLITDKFWERLALQNLDNIHDEIRYYYLTSNFETLVIKQERDGISLVQQ